MKVTREQAAALISDSFPDVDAASARYLGSGTLYDVFLTADSWAFRFPRWDWSGDLFKPEAATHRLVERTIPSSIRVPRVERLAQPSAHFPYPIAGHRHIPGVGADELDDALLPGFAREIAALLNALHSIPLHVARAAGLHEFRMDDGRRAWFETGVNHAKKLRGRDPVIDVAIDWLPTTASTAPFVTPLCVVHGGLEARHVLVDKSTGHIQGVIDWTDSHLGDAARDFVFLVTWKGWRFAEDVLRLYGRPIDEGFRERLRHMAQLLSIMELAYAAADHHDLAAYVRQVHDAFASAAISSTKNEGNDRSV